MVDNNINYSIIIPHYNTPVLLRRCLRSIPQRDDIQVIVVDDNSPGHEGYMENIIELRRKDVELYVTEDGLGAGHARNIGMKYANGKWLLFADADDYYNNGFLEILDKYVNCDEDVIYFNAEYRDGETGKRLENLNFMDEIAQYDGTLASLETIRFHHNVPWTKMVSRDFVKKYSLYFEETPNGNDILFSILVGYLGKRFKVEKAPLYVYLKNPGSLVTDRLFNPEKKICRIIHTVKHNYFYSYINHSEWKVGLVNQILYEIKLSGLLGVVKLLFLVVNKCMFIHKNRKDWVRLLENKQISHNIHCE